MYVGLFGLQFSLHFLSRLTLNLLPSPSFLSLQLMETHYKSNPYHNSTHAADVLHAAAYLVKQLQDKLATHGVGTLTYVHLKTFNQLREIHSTSPPPLSTVEVTIHVGNQVPRTYNLNYLVHAEFELCVLEKKRRIID